MNHCRRRPISDIASPRARQLPAGQRLRAGATGGRCQADTQKEPGCRVGGRGREPLAWNGGDRGRGRAFDVFGARKDPRQQSPYVCFTAKIRADTGVVPSKVYYHVIATRAGGKLARLKRARRASGVRAGVPRSAVGRSLENAADARRSSVGDRAAARNRLVATETRRWIGVKSCARKRRRGR
jgi:hypothetical protein